MVMRACHGERWRGSSLAATLAGTASLRSGRRRDQGLSRYRCFSHEPVSSIIIFLPLGRTLRRSLRPEAAVPTDMLMVAYAWAWRLVAHLSGRLTRERAVMGTSPAPGGRRVWVLVILGVLMLAALGLRLHTVWQRLSQIPDGPVVQLVGDEVGYEALADSLLHGSFFHSPVRGPVYPLFIAA